MFGKIHIYSSLEYPQSIKIILGQRPGICVFFHVWRKKGEHIFEEVDSIAMEDEDHSSVPGRWVVGPGRQNDGPVLEQHITTNVSPFWVWPLWFGP